MEIVICDDGRSHACYLTAYYTGLSTQKNNPVNINFISKRAAQYCTKQIPFMITENNEILTESGTIMKYLAHKSSVGNILYETESDSNKAIVEQWLTFAAERHFLILDDLSLNVINNYLEDNTFFAANHITLADLAMYPSLHQWMKNIGYRTDSYIHICRWFDHIQNLPGIKGVTKSLPLVELQKVDDNTSIKNEELTGKKQEKKEVKNKKCVADTKSNKKREEKKERESKGNEAKKMERPIDDVSRLLIKVGVVTKVWRHPDAEKLYCEEIDIGEETPRKIASGLVGFLKEENFLHQKVLILANMKPRNFRGFLSQGMVLCASSADKTVCELMHPPEDTPIGERVYLEGIEGEADVVMNSKSGKDPFAAVQPSFRVGSDKIGYFKDKKFMTSKGPCFCDTVTEGTIS